MNPDVLARELRNIASEAGALAQRLGRRDLRQRLKDSLHSIVTEADEASERLIVGQLLAKHPNAWLVAEESTAASGRALSRATLRHEDELLFAIDPIDGTAQFASGLADWSVSIGAREEGVHLAGAVVAPRHRLYVWGTSTKANAVQDGKGIPVRVRETKKLERAIVGFGMRFAETGRLDVIQSLAPRCRALYTLGSCALGLAQLAAGRLDACIQLPQRAWDWYGGYPLVLAAGGNVIFFRADGNRLVRVKSPRLAPDPRERQVGFVAANPDLAEPIYRSLADAFRSRRD